MATPTSLITEIRYVLGESTPQFWQNAELTAWITDSIRALQVDLVPDALRALTGISTGTPASESTTLLIPISYLATLELIVTESDGEYGQPWQNVSLETLDQLKRAEGQLSIDTTPTRAFALAGSGTAFYLYPSMAAGRAYRHTYFKTLAESGTLDAPNPVIECVKFRAIMLAASKKSRDLDMMERYSRLYQARVDAINFKYQNAFGLMAAKSGRIRSVSA